MIRYGTPLRYPGGKQKLTPFFMELLESNGSIGEHYVEPYAGGAGIAMQLLLMKRVSHVHLNDSSFPIYAFWHSVVSSPEEFCRRISSASLTVDEWKKQREIVRNPDGHDELEVGFSAFYLNRCNRSGVLTGGLIGGLAQSGKWKIDARFPRNELIQRIEAIALHTDAISLRNWDAERFILEYIPTLPAQTLVYCDPPYFGQSSRLYLDQYTREDHVRIADVIQKQLHQKWVVAYDSAPEILACYSERRMFRYSLQYSVSRVYRGEEVFIFSDELTVPPSSSLPYIDDAIKSNPAVLACRAESGSVANVS